MEINSQEHIKAIAPDVAKAYQLGKEQKYNEAYHIILPLFEAKEIPAQCYYNKAGLFTRYMAGDNHDGIVHILSLMQINLTPLCSFRYTPSSDALSTLYNNVESICSDLDVKITNIVEHLPNYCVYYYLQGAESHSWIQFFITKDGFISYAQSFSDEGLDDGIVRKVVERLCP